MYYKLDAIDLSKQEILDTEPKAKQQTNFIGNLTRAEGARIYFITEEAKKKVLDFSNQAAKIL